MIVSHTTELRSAARVVHDANHCTVSPGLGCLFTWQETGQDNPMNTTLRIAVAQILHVSIPSQDCYKLVCVCRERTREAMLEAKA